MKNISFIKISIVFVDMSVKCIMLQIQRTVGRGVKIRSPDLN